MARIWGGIRGTFALAAIALASGCVGSRPAAVPAKPLADVVPAASPTSIAEYWDCTARELEEMTHEVSVNVLGPRSAQHIRASRCREPGTVETVFVGTLPTPKNPTLAPLNVAELIARASRLDPEMRIELDEYGGLQVRSRELRVLEARLRATPAGERPLLAHELDKRLSMASELALRLAPLGRAFARAQGATQLVHAQLAMVAASTHGVLELDTSPNGAEYRGIATSARRIERVAAATTALISLFQGGLEARVADRTLLDVTRGVRDTLETPLEVTDAAIADEWNQVSRYVRAHPMAELALHRIAGVPAPPPSLDDIADSAQSSRRDPALLDYLWQGDRPSVPDALALVYPEDSAPRQSAESVRAIFDDHVEAALCHARALLKKDCPLTFMLTNVESEIALSRIERALGSNRSKISTR